MGRGDDNRRYVLDREGTAGGHNLWFTSYGTPPIPDIYLMLVWVGGGGHASRFVHPCLSLTLRTPRPPGPQPQPPSPNPGTTSNPHLYPYP